MAGNKKIIKDDTISVRVPKEVKRQAEELADKENLSLSNWLQILIQQEYKQNRP